MDGPQVGANRRPAPQTQPRRAHVWLWRDRRIERRKCRPRGEQVPALSHQPDARRRARGDRARAQGDQRQISARDDKFRRRAQCRARLAAAGAGEILRLPRRALRLLPKRRRLRGAPARSGANVEESPLPRPAAAVSAPGIQLDGADAGGRRLSGREHDRRFARRGGAEVSGERQTQLWWRAG